MNVKELNLKEKTEHFKKMLSDYNTNGTVDILNVYFLIRKCNSFSENFYKEESTYFNSIEEFIDIKSECSNEINNLLKDLKYYYDCCYYSIGVVNEIKWRDSIKCPPLFLGIFGLNTLQTISLLNPNKKDDRELVCIYGADVIMDKLIENSYFAVKGK